MYYVFLQGVNEEQICKNHLILGQHLSKDLAGRDFTMYGGAKMRGKDIKVIPRNDPCIQGNHWLCLVFPRCTQ